MNAQTKPPLILTHQMRQDAYQRDTERAALRRGIADHGEQMTAGLYHALLARIEVLNRRGYL